MLDDFGFPAQVDIEFKHVGAIGEALFNAYSEPRKPIPYYLREFCQKEKPNWISVDDISYRIVDEESEYQAEINGDSRIWRADSVIRASYRESYKEYSDEDPELLVDHGTREWTVYFPVEIKTGEANLDPHSRQRKVMEELASQADIYPIYVGIGIDKSPNEFSIEKFEFIGE